MRILFDQGTPVPLRRFLGEHQIRTAFELDWGHLSNGQLLDQAEAEEFEVLITTDQNLKYQQNLGNRQISILVISTTSWPRIQKVTADILAGINSLKPGDYLEIQIP